MTGTEARNLTPGQRVFWNDPDAGLCSGYTLIRTIEVESGTDPVVRINGELEVYASELSHFGADNA